MSCGCKSNGNNITENSVESGQKSGSILSSMGTMGPMNPNNPIIVRLIYFSIAAPLVLLLLPAVYIILFNHIVIGNPTNLVNLLKKILLIDFVNKIKLKIRERRLRKEEEESKTRRCKAEKRKKWTQEVVKKRRERIEDKNI